MKLNCSNLNSTVLFFWFSLLGALTLYFKWLPIILSPIRLNISCIRRVSLKMVVSKFHIPYRWQNDKQGPREGPKRFLVVLSQDSMSNELSIFRNRIPISLSSLILSFWYSAFVFSSSSSSSSAMSCSTWSSLEAFFVKSGFLGSISGSSAVTIG